jgi:hypothetical protein
MLVTADTVYLDTSAWNALADWSAVRGPKPLCGSEYLFSSCNLDEFSLASALRSKELASFAWRLSNRRKLLDHVELTVAEITAFQRGVDVCYYDRADRGFMPAWTAMRTKGLNDAMRAGHAAHSAQTKASYRDYLREGRDIFGPIFRQAAELGRAQDWATVFADLEQGSEIHDMLISVLAGEDLLRRLPDRSRLSDIPYDALPGTACWVQYHIALYYVAAFESRRLGRPDLGDQVDYRHACYAGVSDVFVTGDVRMHEILSTMVRSCRARVLSPREFLDEALTGHNP